MHRLTRSPQYAVVDADTVFVAPVELMRNGKYVFGRTNQHHVPYFQTYRKLLGQEAPRLPSFIADHMIFDCAIVQELLAEIESRHPGKKWHEAVLESIDSAETSSFSEFETYGHFVARRHPHQFSSAPYANCVLPRETIGAHAKNSKLAVSQGCSSISYHGYRRDDVRSVFGWLSRRIELRSLRVILDAGGGDALTALAMREYVPDASIYTFEGYPVGIEVCRKNLENHSGVSLIESHLGEFNGNSAADAPKALYDLIPPAEKDLANLGLEPGQKLAWMRMDSSVQTLDDWAKAKEIKEIDVLWVNDRKQVAPILFGAPKMARHIKALVIPSKPEGQGDPKEESRLAFALERRGFAQEETGISNPALPNEIFSSRPGRREEPLPEPGVLTMSSLGVNGRFGNQLFQYAFLRVLARHHDLPVWTSPWLGQKLFGLKDPPVAMKLPRIYESRDLTESVFPQILFDEPLVNRDIWGFYQFSTRRYAPHREFIRSLYRPVPAIAEPLVKGLAGLTRGGKRSLVVLHVRRGDFTGKQFFAAPSSWYRAVLENVWPALNDPLLYIASDEPEKVLPEFQDYAPVTQKDLGVEVPGATFYPDFWVMTQADVLGISNSSYSFFASLLAERGRGFYRPHLYQQALIPYDPWDSMPILHRELGESLSDVQERILRKQSEDEAKGPQAIRVVAQTPGGARMITFGPPKGSIDSQKPGGAS